MPCGSNDECGEGMYCGPDLTCIEDPCKADTCLRGMCQPGSTTCVSKESCTAVTEGVACIPGEQCVDGACVDEETYCSQVTCERGVCDFASQSCKSAENCQGDDSLCLAGEFCNSTGQCATDLCILTNTTCPDGGVCVRSVGKCENASPCDSNSECLEGHLCVIDPETSEGVCTLEEVACGDGPGDGGCYGNMICEYDKESQTAACVESGTCTTALDCTGDRQCNGKTCVDPITCSNDDFEPNNTQQEATAFDSEALGGGVDAFICSGDTDVYTVDTHLLAEIVRGTLSVTVDYADRDAGLGELQVELIDPDGATVATATSGPMGFHGFVTVTADVTAANQGEYLVRITDAGDVLTPGISYTLAASFLSDTSIDACTNATRLNPFQTVSSDTRQALSSEFGSTCTEAGNLAAEDIYAFEVSQVSTVKLEVITADPDNSALTVSVRSSCERLDTEVACQANGSDGKKIVMATLEPGTYYAMVQAPVGATGGAYTISLEMGPTYCSPTSSYCEDADTASICNESGTGYDVKTCILGCNPRTGTCFPPQGDFCANPLSKSGEFSATINWQNYRNDYEIPVGGCLPAIGESSTDTWSDGAEAVWAVEVAAQSVMTATLALPEGQGGSLYISESCLQPASSCEAGTNDLNDAGQEILTWVNDTDQVETIFLVADSSAASTMTSATLDVTFVPIICTPGATQCAGDEVETCNTLGTAFEVSESCFYGCNAGACIPPTNDTCQTATTVPVDGAWHDFAGPMQYYSSAVNLENGTEDSCTGFATAGPEAFYAVTLAAGDFVEVEWASPGDGAIWIASSCTDLVNQCVIGDDGGNPETVSYRATTAGTYYIVGDNYSSSPSGTFNMRVRAGTTECDPAIYTPVCVGANSLQICENPGVFSETTCYFGCNAGACNPPANNTCQTATTVPVDGAWHEFSGPTAEYTNDAQVTSTCGDVSDFDSGHHDVFYSVDLQAGDIIQAEWTSGEGTLWLANDCATINSSCVAGVEVVGSPEVLTYTAPTAGRYYIVGDNESSVAADDVYTMRIRASAPECDPAVYTTTCLDAQRIQFCDSPGFITDKSCHFGCNAGACNPPTNLTCQAAFQVPADGAWHEYSAEMSLYNNTVNLGSSSCTGFSTDGPEAFYAVTLAAGETVDVEWTSPDDGAIWIASSCTDLVNQCLVGDDSGNPESISYTASTAGTYYVVGDNYSSSPTGPFTMRIRVY
jgi:hypothetical protein